MPYKTVLTAFVPLLEGRGLSEAEIRTIVIDNPRDLLAGR
ncbi:hypothetical protein [Microbacterium phosphatis]